MHGAIPAEFDDIVVKAAKDWGIEPPSVLRVLNEGKSTALVMTVHVRRDENSEVTISPRSGEYVLKLDVETGHKWDPPEPGEWQRHKQAESKNEMFARSHIPSLTRHHLSGEKAAMLYDLAGRGLTNITTLDHLDASSLRAQARQIARALLYDLNETCKECTRVSPATILRRLLGYRIEAEFLNDFVEQETTGHKHMAWAGQIFANPLWLSKLAALDQQHHLVRFDGLLHGDLHPQNILLDRYRPDSKDFWIIDFALSFDGPLGYDHSYLELAILMRHLAAGGPERLRRHLDALDSPSSTPIIPPEDLGTLLALKEIRGQIDSWRNDKYPKSTDSLDAQFLLARIAAGLNWANKKSLDQGARKMALRYASWYASAYLRHYSPEIWDEVTKDAESGKQQHSPPVSDKDWLQIRESLGNLDFRKGRYVLVTGRLQATHALKCLGLLPWSGVIDLDPDSDRDGLHAAMGPTLAKRRPVQLFGQTAATLDYSRSTGWLMAGGWSTAYESVTTDDDWDWTYPACIRALFGSLRPTGDLQPVYLLVFAETLAQERLRKIVQAAFETLKAAARIVVLGKGQTHTREITKIWPIGPGEFISAVQSTYGAEVDSKAVTIPGKLPSVGIGIEDLNRLEEDLELLHSAVLESEAGQSAVRDHFWRGNPPTWNDLADEVPIKRPFYANPLRDRILHSLKEGPNRTLTLGHGPGAGGTTLSLQVAWDVRRDYPVALLRRYSKKTVDRLDHIFRLTESPILLVADAAVLPEPDREDLYRAAADRHLGLVILYVQRTARALATSDQVFYLPDQMSPDEAGLFRTAFSSKTKDPKRLQDLSSLATSDTGEWKRYRSPFFFGLIAFQDEYLPIATYIKNCLDGASFEIQKVLRFLALITKYTQSAKFTQSGVSTDLAAKLVNYPHSFGYELEELLGAGPSRLVIRQDNILRMSHPILAEQALRMLIGGEQWRAGLKSLSLEFLREIRRCYSPTSKESQQLLESLFVRRYESGAEQLPDWTRHFSPLILAIDSADGQQEIFIELTKLYPAHSHFWNHRARHLIYAMRQHHEEAINCMDKAIHWDPEEMIHYHTKGLVYRFWINTDLDAFRKPGQKPAPDEVLDAVAERCQNAMACFKSAQEKNPASLYPLVTRVQLIIEIAEALTRASGSTQLTVHELLSENKRIGKWLERHLDLAEQDLSAIKRVRADSDPTRFEMGCESGLENLYGNFDEMVRIWEALLQRGTEDDQYARRNLATAYVNRNNRSWEGLGEPALTRIVDLMERNLSSDPTNSTDIRTWFHAHRRLASFSPHAALARLTTWANAHESVEAHYYLYILHFLIWSKSSNRSPIGEQQILTHLNKCRDLAIRLGRGDYCYEWLGREPAWCPLVDHRMLGKLQKRPEPLFADTSSLVRLSGMTEDFSRQAGTVRLSNRLRAFFVPTEEIFSYKGPQQVINFFLGFSYQGFRAWDPALGPVPAGLGGSPIPSSAPASRQLPQPSSAKSSSTIAPGAKPSPLSVELPFYLENLIKNSPSPLRLPEVGEALTKAFPKAFKLYREAGFDNLTAAIRANPRLVVEGPPGREVVRMKKP